MACVGLFSIVRTCSPRGIHWCYAIIRAARVRPCAFDIGGWLSTMPAEWQARQLCY
jgi:hypothetical protein